MAPPLTKSGTRKLSDVARHLVVPSGIVTTGYPAVRDKCRDLGIVHDGWQQGLGRLILGKRADGKYAASIGGVGLSIPRQVGKTFTIGSILFALCILFPRMTVLWTAHRTRTSNETFRAMKGLARRSKIKPFVRTIRSANGEQEIEFHNGSRILFGAREQGFGRGFAEVDVEVFDEAQILTDRALEDMVPATNQARHPAGALLFFMGTPPRPNDPGEAFTRMREEALSGEADDLVWVELSADKGAKPDDWEQVAKANPSYPSRTPREAILRMRKRLGTESFLREGMGIWDELGGPAVFGDGNWDACAAGGRPQGLRIGGLAVAASWDLTHCAIGAAGVRDDVQWLKPLEHGSGSDWLADRLVKLQSVHDVDVAIDERGPAADLIPDLLAAGVRLRTLNTEEVLDACSGIYRRVLAGTARHQHFPELDRAVLGATKRTVHDRWAWGRKTSTADISPLEAVTLAGWLAEQRPEITPPPATPVREQAGQPAVHDLAIAGF